MMDPIAGTIVHAPKAIQTITDGLANTHDGVPFAIEFRFVLLGQGSSPGDYDQTLIVDRLTSYGFERRSGESVVLLEGFSARSEAVPQGRAVRISNLNLIAQTGELFISDYAP